MIIPWLEPLKAAKWPLDVAVLDFETYFNKDYNLSKMSTVEYVTDPRFEELGLSAHVIQAKLPYQEITPHFWRDIALYLRWLQGQYGNNLEGCTVLSQNAAFDGLILCLHHNILPPYYVDLLGLARHWDPRPRNDLASLAKRKGLPPKGDTKQFTGLHWESKLQRSNDPTLFPIREPGMSDKTREALAEYSNHDVWLEAELFKHYMPLLSNPATELPLIRHTLGLFWTPRLQVDVNEANRLIAAMETQEANALATVDCTHKEISGNISFQRLLQDALAPEPVPMKSGKRGPVLAIAKADLEREILLHHERLRVRQLMEARIAIKSWPLHRKRVISIRNQAETRGNLLSILLKYCGAHTGRWSGSEGINPQNLGAHSKDALINGVRRIITAPPEHVLVIADASQIEARVNVQLAGQEDMIQAFARGDPIYCQFASEILGFTVRKVVKSDPPALAKVLKQWRQLGKIGVLGCGYGMGADALQIFAKASYGIDLSPEMAYRIVRHYRTHNAKVVAFWYDVENAFTYVTRYPEKTWELSDLRFHRTDNTTIITLPSSRQLHYPDVQVVGEGRDRTILWPNPRNNSQTRMWGGFLVENIVQAVSRDILAEAILRCEHQAVPIALHVHDEVLGVVPKDRATRALKICIDALRTPPTWAINYPLNAEGMVTERYTK